MVLDRPPNPSAEHQPDRLGWCLGLGSGVCCDSWSPFGIPQGIESRYPSMRPSMGHFSGWFFVWAKKRFAPSGFADLSSLRVG